MTRTPADQAARDRIATDLDTTLVVEAAAGTGKTTALIGRIIAVLRSGRARLEEIVAVTFTEKAAGELKLRLRAALEGARREAAPVERARFEAALEELEAARMGTIHGLCADLLRERPVQAGIDPMFQVADAVGTLRLLDRAFDAFFEDVLQHPPEGIRRVLRREAWREEDRPRHALHRAALELVQTRDFDAPWRRDPFDRDAAIDAFLDDLVPLADLAGEALHPTDHLAQQLALLATWVEALHHTERLNPRDHDGLEASLRALRSTRYKWTWTGARYREAYSHHLSRDAVLRRRDAVKARLDALVDACDADLAPCLREELRPVVDRYQAIKRQEGLLDFHDLLQCARDLLVRDADVRATLQRRFRYLLVDEFQDTDPLQAEIVLLLASDDPACEDPSAVSVAPGKLFVVGDPKQSIYRFRRADVAFYARVKAQLIAHGAVVLPLSTSFRSDPRIQQAINAALAPRMQGGTQADYVPLDPWRDETAGRPAVVALPAPRIHGRWGTVWEGEIAASEPEAVAAWVRWLLHESGWTIDDPASGEAPVPVAARHVCLLFKRFQASGQPITTPYTQALEKRDVPHVLVGGRALHHREEVLALRAALEAIERPDDELSVFATLRGPLFAVGDDALLAWRAARGRLDPLRAGEVGGLTEVLAEVHGALDVLATLHRARNRRPIADTVHALLEATRAHAGLANWVAGEQALANVLRVAELARRFEAGGATSFRAFLEHLTQEARRGEAAEAPVVEEGTEGVRIMTVHGAKGLEFPVVVLCDITCPPSWERPSRWVDPAARIWATPLAGCLPAVLRDHAADVLRQDAEEADRLLYVAATRARDVLVVPVVGEGPLERSWVAPLAPALYPPSARWRAAEPAEGCPRFGDDSVAERHEQATADSVRPGRLRPAAGGHDVVWWDPGVLDLRVRRATGLRSQDLLVDDPDGRGDRSLAEHAAWREGRAERLARASRLGMAVSTPSTLSDDLVAPPPRAVRVESTEAATGVRPGGRRFGTLVHAVLADVPLDATHASIAASARLNGRMVGAPPGEVDAAAHAAEAALQHPVLQSAAASMDCRREVALTVRIADDALIEGVADLAFLAPARDRWVVVDFKSDRALDAHLEHYERQIRWYAEALARATGLPVDAVLLRV